MTATDALGTPLTTPLILSETEPLLLTGPLDLSAALAPQDVLADSLFHFAYDDSGPVPASDPDTAGRGPPDGPTGTGPPRRALDALSGHRVQSRPAPFAPHPAAVRRHRLAGGDPAPLPSRPDHTGRAVADPVPRRAQP
ncbi:hypothetical protein [Jannaschia sp. M317]|uniref:hypothetical protein n=1 Tax=Jannaschia sp. M317 TaxID=2867011 RepID=UPI0021A92893|nr:hypothetical protein [Jannaschia sp. M317]UWQ19940.1 hypothetical protein K3551_19535 [Jannaschia sp. M317]